MMKPPARGAQTAPQHPHQLPPIGHLAGAPPELASIAAQLQAGVMHGAAACQEEDEEMSGSEGDDDTPRPARQGRRKIKIEYIHDKSRRHITFSKRKAGIMKKAYELSTLTGTQVLLLVASETGHVYTFATPKLQPIITKDEGKNLIQACLNAPDDSAERPEAAESSKPKTAGGRKAAAKKETPAKEPKAKGGRKAAASASGAGVGPSADSQQTSVAPSPVLAGPGATSALGYQQASASPFAYASNYGLPQGATVLPYYVSNQNGQPQYLAYSYPGGGNAAQAAQQQVQLLMMNPDGTASYQTGGFNNAAQQLVLLQPQVDGGGAGGDGGAGEKRN